MISRRAVAVALVSAPAVALLERTAFAAFPDHPIRMVVPFAAGGNADIVARLVGQGMSTVLGQPVVIDNRAGAGGSVGAEAVARSDPDGYMLLVGSNGPLTVNPFVQAKLGYDPLKDFAPIALTSYVPHVLIVHPSITAATIPDFVALSQQHSVTTGTSGVGSATHMTLERFIARTGAKLEHVPYRSGGALMPDLIAGNIQSAITELSTALPLHRAGQGRILAIASEQRSRLAPDIPTMIDGGVKDFTASSYIGILAPSATPADTVTSLSAAIEKAFTDDKIRDKFVQLGAELASPEQMRPQGFAAFLREDFERMREAAQRAGLTPQ
jgi:tripartite-type tricarboxylate transporter receptor subunit TctC